MELFGMTLTEIVLYGVLIFVCIFFVLMFWVIDSENNPKNPYKGENTFPDDY